MSSADPLHTDVPAGTTWTTVNVSEAMPGVLTPLTWTFWMPAIERGSRRSYVAQGIFPRRLGEVPDDPADRFQAVFFGRAALNPDLARLLGDLAPGTTGAATEQRVLGFARDLPDRSTNRRAPFVAVRLPVQVGTIGRRVHRLLDATRTWWTTTTGTEPADLPAAVDVVLEARRRFGAIIELHTTATCVGLLFAEALDRLAPIPGLVDRATTGLGDLEELDLVRGLVAVAEGRGTIAEVVARHGFHGPDEGQLQSRSWRQDPTQLEPLVERYRGLPDDRSPGVVLARQTDVRTVAVEQLLAGVAPRRRPVVRWLLRRIVASLPLREVGKSAFLMALDVGRHGARRAGELLVEAGVLTDVDDVFLLTVDELAALRDGPADRVALAALLAERRERQRRYEALDLPTVWEGPPEAIERTATDAVGRGTVLTGEGAAPGAVEGRLLVAPDLGTAFGAMPGDIVVCQTTDPSWAAVFPVIDGIVVEVGSHLSHAAIVARELGLPCVVGIDRATERLTTGMVVRLDAEAGTVTVLADADEEAR